MEKIKFVFDDTKDEVEFFVLGQTKVNWKFVYFSDGFRRR